MMHPRRIVLVVLALLSFSPRPALADGFLSPFVGFGFGSETPSCASLTNCEDHRLSWGVSIGSNSGAFGVEEDIAYAPDFFGRTPGFDNAMLTAMSNLMVVIPAGPVHPYGVFGVGLMRPHVELTDLTSLSKTAFGWDFGGRLNIFLTKGFGLRGDIRRLRSFEKITLGIFGNENIDFWRGSAGVTLRF
jgi:hypothetical protein